MFQIPLFLGLELKTNPRCAQNLHTCRVNAQPLQGRKVADLQLKSRMRPSGLAIRPRYTLPYTLTDILKHE